MAYYFLFSFLGPSPVNVLLTLVNILNKQFLGLVNSLHTLFKIFTRVLTKYKGNQKKSHNFLSNKS